MIQRPTRRAVTAGLALGAAAWPFVGNAAPGRKFALLIGNESYGPGVGELRNPVNDVKLVERVLRASGFAETDLLVLPNAGKQAMRQAVTTYVDRLLKGGPDATGVFYYGGHGATDATTGKGYLIPRDATSAKSAKLWQESIAVDAVLDELAKFAGAKIALFDCCRNELDLAAPVQPPPGVAAVTASALPNSRGFVAVRAQRRPNLFMSHATWEGETALDGVGDARNGPFALAFAESIGAARAGARLTDIFDDVRLRVLSATGDAQEPMNLSRMTKAGAAVMPFVPGASAAPPVRRAPPHALVIGNTYAAHEDLNLPIAKLDAEMVAGALANSGFVVTRHVNLGKAEIEKSVEKFARSLTDAACVVYLSGYAFGGGGQNFFLPELSAADRRAGVQSIGIPVWGIVERLLAARAQAVFVALDCARPFSGSPGARVPEEAVEEMRQSQKNVVIAYSAEARTWALDPRARSPFAAAFADIVQQPARRKLQDVAKLVQGRVLQATSGGQRPWFQSANGVPIYFRDGRDLSVIDG